MLLRNVDLSGACGEPAIDVAESALWLWDVKLSGNRAQQGSTVHARDAVVQARNLDAVDNHATESGGVVWASGSTVNLTSSTFRHNSASVFGGAVYLEFSSFTGIDVVFHNNSVRCCLQLPAGAVAGADCDACRPPVPCLPCRWKRQHCAMSPAARCLPLGRSTCCWNPPTSWRTV